MVDFKSLKKASGTASFQKLRDEIKKTQSTYEKDDRFWAPTVDSAGNGSATIRFLPACSGEEVPFVRYYSHNFKGPTGRYYINMSLTTLDRSDPVTDLNSKLWNSTSDDESPARKMARRQKRNLNFVSNILVVRDPGNVENEGKVFLYRYGKKIWDKIEAIANPQSEDDESINPFDMWKGANFRIRIKKVKDWRNYDDSSFESPSPLARDDESIAEIWSKTYPLLPEVSEDKFLPYDVLEKKLYDVIGNTASVILNENVNESSADSRSRAEFDTNDEPERESRFQSSRPTHHVNTTVDSDKQEDGDSKEDDDILNMFKNL